MLARDSNFEILCTARAGIETMEFSDNESESSLLFQHNGALYLWQNAEDSLQAEKFTRQGNQKLKKESWEEKMRTVILPLTKEYQVEFDKSLTREVKDTAPEIRLLLQEKGDYLLFQPVFNYKGVDTKLTDKPTLTIPDGDKILVIHRNIAVSYTHLDVYKRQP